MYPLVSPLGDGSNEDAGAWPAGAEILRDPMPVARLIEFRPDGALEVLARDPVSGELFLIDEIRYDLPSANTLRIDGRCWKSRQRYACSADYPVQIGPDSLTIASWSYRRADPIASESGVAVAPPAPAPTASP